MKEPINLKVFLVGLKQAVVKASPLVFMAHPLPMFVLAKGLLQLLGKSRFRLNMLLLIVGEYVALYLIYTCIKHVPVLEKLFLGHRSYS